jgi:nicotinamidase-related amidase
MSLHTQLLIIDPQNDFCDLPPDWCPTDPRTGDRIGPALPVPGAHADMQRLADFIAEHGDAIDAITITLDSHHRWDIAHPGFWRRGDGTAVAPFTEITAAQLRDGRFSTADPSAGPRAQAYLDALEERGRYTLMAWPVHCQIGSWGHAVHVGVLAACNAWEDRRQRAVQAIFKGSNPWTEHYSAVQAEVPDPEDADTELNRALLDSLDQARRVYVAGEAGSHCVRATTDHLAEHLGTGFLRRLTLLTDGMSAVRGFEMQQREFLGHMQRHGVRLAAMRDIRSV